MSIIKKWWFHAAILAILAGLSYYLWKSAGQDSRYESSIGGPQVEYTVTDFESLPTEELPKAVFWISTKGAIDLNQAEAMLYSHLQANGSRYSEIYYNLYFGKRKDGKKKSPHTGDSPDMEYSWNGEMLTRILQ